MSLGLLPIVLLAHGDSVYETEAKQSPVESRGRAVKPENLV